MNTRLTTRLAMFVLIGAATAAPLAAQAAVGAVKVECWGDCSRVNLGSICDRYMQFSVPVAIACDETADPGSFSSDLACGGASCRAFGSLIRGDLLSAYCVDGGGHDAIVTCSSGAQAAAAPQMLRNPGLPTDGAEPEQTK